METREKIIIRTEKLINYLLKTTDTKLYLYEYQNSNPHENIEETSTYPILDTSGEKVGQLNLDILSEDDRAAVGLLLSGMLSHIECVDTITQLNENKTYLDKQLGWKSSELSDLYEDLNLAHEELNALFNSKIELKESMTELKEQMAGFLQDAPIAFGILRGKKLVIEVANRLILRVWGKNESVLGIPLEDAIPELRGQPYLQILEDVYNSGERYIGKQARVLLERNGSNDITYFNFIYEPIKSTGGEVHGIMIFANEVTELILAQNG
ncbi:hypothetical protein [Pedobacter aquatilis]|uniref:hypothetical protein n=1 Tax=Pedobacter aquatilis TaxID=351343 RepID=UPI00292EBBF4|nr:hypothetical protein [Pedobacter aquatilis]